MFGVESFSTKQLDALVKMYDRKLPRLGIDLLTHLRPFKALEQLTSAQKQLVDEEEEAIKRELGLQDLQGYLDYDVNFMRDKLVRLRAKRQACIDELAKREKVVVKLG